MGENKNEMNRLFLTIVYHLGACWRQGISCHLCGPWLHVGRGTSARQNARAQLVNCDLEINYRVVVFLFSPPLPSML